MFLPQSTLSNPALLLQTCNVPFGSLVVPRPDVENQCANGPFLIFPVFLHLIPPLNSCKCFCCLHCNVLTTVCSNKPACNRNNRFSASRGQRQLHNPPLPLINPLNWILSIEMTEEWNLLPLVSFNNNILQFFGCQREYGINLIPKSIRLVYFTSIPRPA